MRIKGDWLAILHDLRTRELERVFRKVPENAFGNSLEIGAGDGFQSALLVKYTKKLLCTEYDELKLVRSPDPRITYRICDAEKLDEYFQPDSFDLIFSSNLMEHLAQPQKAFRDMQALLTDDGVMVHIMPGPFVKFCWLALFYPSQAANLFEQLTSRGGLKTVGKMAAGDGQAIAAHRGDLGNNPKGRQRRWLLTQLWPEPHGAYSSHLAEFTAYRPARWKKLLEASGFEVIAVKKLPVTSGYGFGLETLRRLFEKLGFSYGYAYVSVKKGRQPARAAYFR